jgi:hypothetical protein
MDFSLQSGLWRTVERKLTLPAVGNLIILTPNPLRWAFAVGGSSVAFFISTQGGAQPTTGGLNVAALATFLVRFPDYAGAVQQQWWGQTSGGGSQITVLEILENIQIEQTQEEIDNVS